MTEKEQIENIRKLVKNVIRNFKEENNVGTKIGIAKCILIEIDIQLQHLNLILGTLKEYLNKYEDH